MTRTTGRVGLEVDDHVEACCHVFCQQLTPVVTIDITIYPRLEVRTGSDELTTDDETCTYNQLAGGDTRIVRVAIALQGDTLHLQRVDVVVVVHDIV